MFRIAICLTLLLPGLSSLSSAAPAEDPRLLEAVQQQDLPRVRALLAAGADVDTPSRYGATALFFACDKGNLELVELLLENGAEVNVTDTFYGSTPTGWALSKASDSPVHRKIVQILLRHGEVLQRDPQIRPGPQRRPVCGHRLLGPAELAQRVAEVVVRFGVIGIGCQGLLVERDGRLEAALLGQHQAQCV